MKGQPETVMMFVRQPHAEYRIAGAVGRRGEDQPVLQFGVRVLSLGYCVFQLLQHQWQVDSDTSAHKDLHWSRH
jgi:hypothetical protein